MVVEMRRNRKFTVPFRGVTLTLFSTLTAYLSGKRNPFLGGEGGQGRKSVQEV